MLQFAPIKFWPGVGGSLFSQVKSVVIKISFNKGGVTLQFAPMKFLLGGQLGQVKSVVIKIPFMGGVLFWSTHIHTPYRLDKPQSALAEARLKTLLCRNFVAGGNYAK